MIPALLALAAARYSPATPLRDSAVHPKPFDRTVEACGLAFRQRHWQLYRVTARVCPSPARRRR